MFHALPSESLASCISNREAEHGGIVPEETRNIIRHDQPHEMTAAVGSVELIFGRPHGVV
jgi:hypothetical protein